MNTFAKAALAALAISAPTFASADAIAVSLGATFAPNTETTIGAFDPIAGVLITDLEQVESLSVAAASADGSNQTNHAAASSNAMHAAGVDQSSTSASAVASDAAITSTNNTAIVVTTTVSDISTGSNVPNRAYITTLTLSN